MENLFEMGADFDDGWTSDNKDKPNINSSLNLKDPCKHQLHFVKEKRSGKVVTIVKPFFLSKSDLRILLKTLKKKLGTGGTVKENSLEFQGDIAEKVRTHLKALHYGFKQ